MLTFLTLILSPLSPLTFTSGEVVEIMRPLPQGLSRSDNPHNPPLPERVGCLLEKERDQLELLELFYEGDEGVIGRGRMTLEVRDILEDDLDLKWWPDECSGLLQKDYTTSASPCGQCPEGAKGVKGVKGQPGDKGPQGLQGQPGVKGRQGRTGPPGGKGPTGGKGSPGEKGPRGEDGLQGPPGDKGANGPDGRPGILLHSSNSGHISGGKTEKLCRKEEFEEYPPVPPKNNDEKEEDEDEKPLLPLIVSFNEEEKK